MFFPVPEQYPTWVLWAKQLVLYFNEKKQTEPVKLPEFPVARLPTPNQNGLLAFALDDTDRPQPVYSYNGEWLRFDGTAPEANFVFNVKAKRFRVHSGDITIN